MRVEWVEEVERRVAVEESVSGFFGVSWEWREGERGVTEHLDC